MLANEPSVQARELSSDIASLRETSARLVRHDQELEALQQRCAVMRDEIAGVRAEIETLRSEGLLGDDERFVDLDARIRQQHLENHQALNALIDSQRLLIDGQRTMSDDVKAIRARMDAFIRGRNNGEQPPDAPRS